jgi:response regulator of citrate/malate metabolism
MSKIVRELIDAIEVQVAGWRVLYAIEEPIHPRLLKAIEAVEASLGKDALQAGCEISQEELDKLRQIEARMMRQYASFVNGLSHQILSEVSRRLAQ